MSVLLTYTIQDAKAQKALLKLSFPDSTDIAILKVFARSTAAMIDDLIMGRITDMSINLGVNLPSGIKTAAASSADVQERGRFVFRTASGIATSIILPTFDELGCLPASERIDAMNDFVDTFVDRIISGQTIGFINVSPSDDRGESITSFDHGFMTYRV